MEPKRILGILVALLFTSTCYAELTMDEAEQVMLGFRTKLIQSVNSKDSTAIANAFDEQGIMILGSSKLLRTREEIKNFMHSPYLNEEVKISGFMVNELNTDKPFVILDDNTFIATGTAFYQIIFNKSKKVALPNHWIMVFHRTDGKWHIASYQGTVNVFDNPYIDDMRYIFYLICLITFLLGIIAAVAWRRLKKSKLI